MKKIVNIRKKIDKLDRKIIQSLEKRFKEVLDIKRLKKANLLEIYQSNRQNEVLANNQKTLKHSEDKRFYENIYQTIFLESQKYQYYRVCLLGQNTSNSGSPTIYQYLAKKYNVNLTYETANIGSGAEFFNYLQGLKIGKFDALNITNPFKKYAFLIYDELDEASLVSESSNIVAYENSRYHCYNTDYYGLANLLKRQNIEVKDKKILILGNGATAKSIYHLLLSSTLDITVCLRSDSVHERNFLKTIYYEDLTSLKPFDIVINATPVVDIVELEAELDLIYLDLNYVSKITIPPHVRYISGFELLIEQAILNMQIFFPLQNIELNDFEYQELLAILQGGLE
ncbi:MAG: chorismate mutase [Acholeplasmatales bacterium]|jgi:shikimate dehydrogenase|nr:chorismate mutase [Acholeplasmatales bacterium]